MDGGGNLLLFGIGIFCLIVILWRYLHSRMMGQGETSNSEAPFTPTVLPRAFGLRRKSTRWYPKLAAVPGLGYEGKSEIDRTLLPGFDAVPRESDSGGYLWPTSDGRA